MRHFISTMREWIQRHATTPDGYAFSQRQIEQMLGLSGAEIATWMSDRARPGIARLLHLRESGINPST